LLLARELDEFGMILPADEKFGTAKDLANLVTIAIGAKSLFAVIGQMDVQAPGWRVAVARKYLASVSVTAALRLIPGCPMLPPRRGDCR